MINKTFEELGEYRSPDGYIDFDRVVEENEVETKREYRGNVNREKDWIEIEGGSVLVKTDADGQPNSEYSELISCALAKQAGIETAQYDMVRYKGETGLITKNMCKPGEEMISIYELIGNGPDSEICPDTIDIYHVFDNLDEKLQAEGFDDNSLTYYGRAYFNAPDIDGKVLFTSETPIEYGKTYQVKVIDCTDYDIIASVIK